MSDIEITLKLPSELVERARAKLMNSASLLSNALKLKFADAKPHGS